MLVKHQVKYNTKCKTCYILNQSIIIIQNAVGRFFDSTAFRIYKNNYVRQNVRNENV